MVESEHVSHDPQVFGQCSDTPSRSHFQLGSRATHSHDFKLLFPLFSEFVADIAQALFEDETCNPEELFSEMAKEIKPGEFGKAPFAIARELSIKIKAKVVSIDVYIQDLITVLLYSESWFQRIRNVIPLILNCSIRPLTNLPKAERSRIQEKTSYT